MRAHVFQLQRYGYFMLDRTKDGWTGTAFSVDDQVLGMCRLTGREIHCLLSSELPAQPAASSMSSK